VRETAFYFWRRELEERDAAERRCTTFLPVRVTAAPAQRVTGEAWPAPRREPSQPLGRIVIVLAGGRRIHVAPPVDRQALAEVLAALSLDPARDGEATAC
jgi:hypothetical protein